MKPTSWQECGDLEKLAYRVYVETIEALRTGNDPEDLESVSHATKVGTWLERKALGLAMSDYLSCVPVRSPQEFHAALPMA